MALWLPMWLAPSDRPILLRTKSRPRGFEASRGGPYPGSNDEDCWGWAAADEDAAPPSWTDGVCWAVNADMVPSERPTGWRPRRLWNTRKQKEPTK